MLGTEFLSVMWGAHGAKKCEHEWCGRCGGEAPGPARAPLGPASRAPPCAPSCAASRAPPCAALRAPPRRAPHAAAAGRASHRKPRSRSSPVRTGSRSPAGRARSPSASPPPRAPPPRAAPPRDAFDHKDHLLKQRAGLSCTSSYFSRRPPACPVRLASGAGLRAPEPAPLGPCAADVPPPPATAPRPAPSAPLAPPSAACRRAVRVLLADLVSALPLLPSPSDTYLHPPSPYSTHSYSSDMRLDEGQLLPESLCSPPVTPRGAGCLSPAPRAPAPRAPPRAPRVADDPARLACRSVAVQALDHKRAEEHNDRDPYDESMHEGWVGGVRALRDSHVRLVLRQLRHIERLNRALDHVARPAAHARPAPPTPPAPAARPAAPAPETRRTRRTERTVYNHL